MTSAGNDLSWLQCRHNNSRAGARAGTPGGCIAFDVPHPSLEVGRIPALALPPFSPVTWLVTDLSAIRSAFTLAVSACLSLPDLTTVFDAPSCGLATAATVKPAATTPLPRAIEIALGWPDPRCVAWNLMLAEQVIPIAEAPWPRHSERSAA
jgi:hypothetical protein